MRSIALAIVLAGSGIEYAVMKANGIEREYPVATGVFVLLTLIAFVVCLIIGA